MSLQKLCRLEDIDDGNARGFDVLVDGKSQSVIVVRQAQQVFVYKNNCPHTGINLEWMPDEFLDDTGQYLVCSTHGAMFQVDDGYCVAGPCAGDALQALPIRQEQGNIFIETNEMVTN